MTKTSENSSMVISVAQIDIKKGDKKSNLDKISSIAKSLKGVADIVVFPETVTTGFGLDEYNTSEEVGGYTHKTISEISRANGVGIICSFFTSVGKETYNRLYFFMPNGEFLFQDKRHLFSFAGEDRFISGTKERRIFEYKGWKILPTVCYDIRFPVWCRNVDNEYDILINISNWPKVRQEALDILLRARAVENMSYVISANRCGADGNGFDHVGRSVIIDPKGKVMSLAKDNGEEIITSVLSMDELNNFRKKFPAYMDADKFELIV